MRTKRTKEEEKKNNHEIHGEETTAEPTDTRRRIRLNKNPDWKYLPKTRQDDNPGAEKRTNVGQRRRSCRLCLKKMKKCRLRVNCKGRSKHLENGLDVSDL